MGYETVRCWSNCWKSKWRRENGLRRYPMRLQKFWCRTYCWMGKLRVIHPKLETWLDILWTRILPSPRLVSLAKVKAPPCVAHLNWWRYFVVMKPQNVWRMRYYSRCESKDCVMSNSGRATHKRGDRICKQVLRLSWNVSLWDGQLLHDCYTLSNRTWAQILEREG